MSHHSNGFYFFVVRSTDQLRLQFWNGETLALFFAQVVLVYGVYNIKYSQKEYNLDETGFSTGRDLSGTNGKRVLKSVGMTVP